MAIRMIYTAVCGLCGARYEAETPEQAYALAAACEEVGIPERLFDEGDLIEFSKGRGLNDCLLEGRRYRVIECTKIVRHIDRVTGKSQHRYELTLCHENKPYWDAVMHDQRLTRYITRGLAKVIQE